MKADEALPPDTVVDLTEALVSAHVVVSEVAQRLQHLANALDTYSKALFMPELDQTAADVQGLAETLAAARDCAQLAQALTERTRVTALH